MNAEDDQQTLTEYSRTGTNGLWSDVIAFVVRRPALTTHLDLSLRSQREMYDRRVLEHLGVDVGDTTILNIHRIGIDAPPAFVWDLWTRRERNSDYWPTSLVLPAWHGAGSEQAELLLFGNPHLSLFRVDLVRRRDTPDQEAHDDARYALYRCSGGYPVGVAATYVRPPIVTEGESEPAQMFFIVSFDFFGKKHWLGTHAVRPLWESIHNRVTTHVLSRFKERCEQRYAAHVPFQRTA